MDELSAWVSSKPEISGAGTRVCWLRGSPRVSTLATAALVAAKYKDEGTLACSFFFSREDPEINHPRHLSLAIAHGLASYSEDLQRLINDTIQSQPRLLAASMETQFSQLVARPLLQGKTPRAPVTLLVVINGLDECIEARDQQRVLSLVASAAKDGLPLRFLIGSQPNDILWDHFNKASDTKFLRLDGDAVADQRVRNIFINEFRRLQSTKKLQQIPLPRRWPSNQEVEALIETAVGETEFAYTLVRTLEYHPSPQRQLTRILKSASQKLPTSSLSTPLNLLYTHIVESAIGRYVPGERSSDILISIAALRATSPAKKTLLPHHLITRDFLELLWDDFTVADVLRGLRSCLLERPGGEIKAYHPSFLQYLLLVPGESLGEHYVRLFSRWFECLSKKDMQLKAQSLYHK
ncbi:hypothetical protein AAF712_012809 [Marasmius tenuissimus]|uniref:Nephrocystin 3-like N-terminal domain-containing protein n=1 Tax=Marasmius tenuissimus TaxID=585030 RepID=A0ABR2ZGS5_9AGAR